MGSCAVRSTRPGSPSTTSRRCPHISVAGACATATHGSGDAIGNLATAVVGDGAGHRRRRDRRLRPRPRSRRFDGAVVALGALGVVTKLTLDLQPTFRMRQDLYEDLPLAVAVEQFDEISSSADSVSLFTDWRGPTIEQVWLKRRVPDGDTFEPPPTFFGATRATTPIHPIRRDVARRLDRAARRAGSVARTAAPLPDGPHAEQRRGAPERVPPPAPPRRRGPPGDRRHPRRGSPRCSRSPRFARSPPMTSG